MAWTECGPFQATLSRPVDIYTQALLITYLKSRRNTICNIKTTHFEDEKRTQTLRLLKHRKHLLCI